jgi:hypothetical protein
MKIQLRITPNEGEPYELETNLFVIVAWERKFKQKASTLANGIGIEDLAFMAYECCKQQNITVPITFDSFINQISAVEVVGSEDPKATEATVTEEP